MTATVTTVTTVVTKRKLLRNKVNPKALMWKVTVSPTTNTSFKKKIPRNPVIIVKIGMCLHLRWLNVQAAFGTITIVFVPFVVTKFPLMPNM